MSLLLKQMNCLTKAYKTGLLSIVMNNSLSKSGLASVATPTGLTGAQPIGKRKFRLPVEEDANRLVNYCCGANYAKDGEDVKIKADEEYPDWIWSLRLNYPPPLHELDPNTKEFYERLEVVGQQRQWKVRSITKNQYKIVSKTLIQLEQLRYRRRFRALASKEFDAGYEVVEHTEREDYWELAAKERFREPPETQTFYPGIDSVDIPYAVSSNRLRLKPPKKCGHFGS